MKLRKLITGLLIGALMAASLTACRSKDSTQTTQSAGNDTALTLDQIKKNGKLVVATEAAYEPFEYLDRKSVV